MTRLFWVLIGLLMLAPALRGAETSVDYLHQIKPILAARCYSCHGALKSESGLRLDTGELVRKGGESGAIVDLDDPAASIVLERITEPDESLRMPPEGQALTDQQIELIKRWIAEGARSPADEQPEEDLRSHWSFQRPERPPLPAVEHSDWIHNPIDAFIAASHEARGLRPLGSAKREILLRRVYLDLIGLPPTRQQLHAFLVDESSGAYQRVVDSLLDNHHHGERWGRHWMDVWRYSDWYGRRQVNDVRNSYPHIWRWRDWIINSLNDDKGYDQMIREMLASDELYPDDDGRIAALGFIVRNWFSLNYDTWKQDLVEHTGKALLGLRLNCAHCHDHKYDPITQEEYFRFRAFFEPLEFRHDRVPGGERLTKYIRYKPGSGGSLQPIPAGLPRVYDHYHDQPTHMYRLGDTRDRFARPPVEPGAPAILGGDQLAIEAVHLPAVAWYPGLKDFVAADEVAECERAVAAARDALQQHHDNQHNPSLSQQLAKAEQVLAESKNAGPVNDQADSDAVAQLAAAVKQLRAQQQAHRLARIAAEAELVSATAQLRSVQARLAADQSRYMMSGDNPAVLAKHAARAEQEAKLLASRARSAQAESALAELLRAAEPDSKKIAQARKSLAAAQKVVAQQEVKTVDSGANYSGFGPQYPKVSTGRRRALALWIASPENPLTARVAINHIWMRHFGRPLVETVFDFGRAGKRPVHPELLDWLAVELMENDWSMKHIHRLIVTSSTYQLSSRPGISEHPNFAIDKDNSLLWKYDRQRLEAEVVRDSILHISGQLDTTFGGQDLDPQRALETRRRSLYYTVYPEAGGMMRFMTLFDAPDPCDCYRRTQSIVPQQALAMSNSNLVLAQGPALVKNLLATTPARDRHDNDDPFITAVFERILCRGASSTEASACREFLTTQRSLYEAESKQDNDLRAWESLVRVLLNHNEFITIH